MTQSMFEKHPRKTIFAFVLVLLFLIGVVAEIVLRFTVPYDIGYYTAIRKEGVYEYPYGRIAINKQGYPDTEFDLTSTKPRIGYFGDSIIMGIGAGDGYRFGDLVEAAYPQYDHWTFGVMGNGIRENDLLRQAQTYNLNYVVYGMNLNDFLPQSESATDLPIAKEGQSWFEVSLLKFRYHVIRRLDWLRGKSYLYTVLRTGAKNILEIAGYGYTGFKSIEFYPSGHTDIISEVAQRFNQTALRLNEQGITFCLVIFPYEMQISDVAAQTYADMGFKWEDGFTDGSTQKLFQSYLSIQHIYDGLDAFPGEEKQSATGTYFVYNKGDKIDFNHPNREGHAVLAKGWMESKICPFLD